MKHTLTIFAIMFSIPANAGIYTNASNFRPYIGIDAGVNISDYTYETDLDDTYYSATINAGARIGHNFGVELFFTHSSTNNLSMIDSFSSLDHEVYYMGYGFDIFGYYPVSRNFDFFTSFGIANYKVYNKYEYIEPFSETSLTTSDNNVSSRFGIGILYTFPGDNISGLLQYQYTPLSSELFNNMSEFSIGIRYTF